MRLIKFFVLIVPVLLASCLPPDPSDTSSHIPITPILESVIDMPASFDEAPTRESIHPVLTSTPAPEPLVLTMCKSRTGLFYPDYSDPLLPIEFAEPYNLTSLPEYSDLDAEETIEFIRGYPRSLQYQERGYHDSSYFHAFRYVVTIEDNALFQFPYSDLASVWLWDRAFNLFLSGDDLMYDAYKDILYEGLNTELVSPEDLSCWFRSLEDRLQLKVVSLAGFSPSREGSFLVQISDSQEIVGIFFFLHRDGPTFMVHPLTYEYSWPFSTASGIEFDVVDFTGDFVPEVATSHVYFPGSGDAIRTHLDVYDILTGAPILLEFVPEISPRRERSWQVVTSDNDPPLFRISKTYNRMTCPFSHSWIYQWDGEAMALVEREIPTKDQIIEQIGKPIGQTDALECTDIYVSSFVRELRSGDMTNPDPLLELIEGWPYSSDPWPLYDDIDELDPYYTKYLIGVSLTNIAEYDKARDLFDSISASISDDQSELAQSLRIFRTVSSRDEFITACQLSDDCKRYLGLDELLGALAPEEILNIENVLSDLEYQVFRSGNIDLNDDGTEEKWIAVTLDEDPYGTNIWFFLNTEDGAVVESIWADLPTDQINLKEGPGFFGQPSFTISDGATTQYRLYSESNPWRSILTLCEVLSEHIHDLGESLYNKDSYTQIDNIEKIRDLLENNCDETYIEWLDPQLIYFYAQLHELIGMDQIAIRAHLEIIEKYPESPYSLLSAKRLLIK